MLNRLNVRIERKREFIFKSNYHDQKIIETYTFPKTYSDKKIISKFIYRLSKPVDGCNRAIDEDELRTDNNDPSQTGILSDDSVIIINAFFLNA